jgi:preprotein translocase subunit YajC
MVNEIVSGQLSPGGANVEPGDRVRVFSGDEGTVVEKSAEGLYIVDCDIVGRLKVNAEDIAPIGRAEPYEDD